MRYHLVCHTREQQATTKALFFFYTIQVSFAKMCKCNNNGFVIFSKLPFLNPPPPCFTPSSAPDERFPLVRTSGSRLWSSLWPAYWGPELRQSLPVDPLHWSAADRCTRRLLWHDVDPCWRWRKVAGALSWHCCCCPASESGWDSSGPWSGPPVAACNSLYECRQSLIVSAWNTEHTPDKCVFNPVFSRLVLWSYC